MIVGSHHIECDGVYFMSETFKFIVSMCGSDHEASGHIQLNDLKQGIFHGGFGLVGDWASVTEANAPGDAM